MKVGVFVSVLLLGDSSGILLYILNSDSGKTLTSAATACSFQDQKFSLSSQLWTFSAAGSLHSAGLYLGFDPTTNVVQLTAQDPGIRWAWDDGRLKGGDDSQCLDVSATKMVQCDQGANITLEVYNTELHDMITTLHEMVNNYSGSVTSISTNITDMASKTVLVVKELSDAAINLTRWKEDIQDYLATFNTEWRAIKDNITLNEATMKDTIGELTGQMSTIKDDLVDVTQHVSNISFNFTELNAQLYNHTNSTNITIHEQVERFQAILDKKADQGRFVPDNIYDFMVLILLGLGVINVVDVVRRVLKHALSQQDHIQYGME